MKSSLESSSIHRVLSARDLGDFFTSYRAEFLTHARRLLGATSEAEEVVQDAFVRVLLASPELTSINQAKAYFHKVVENLAIDVHRRNSRRPRLVLLDESSLEQEESWTQEPDVAALVEQANDAAIIREAIALLSPAERAALVMWEFEERSTSDIAKELGVKESTVRHTVSRARTNLRRILAERIIDEQRGLTALDLLSITFRKSKVVIRKSSKIALSLVLVLSAFIGFNSLDARDFINNNAASVSETESPGPVIVGESQSPEIVTREDEQSVVKRDSLLENRDVEKSELVEFNSTSFDTIFPGLNIDGSPVGFTIVDSSGNVGLLFSGQQRVVPSESGIILSNISSTRSGGAKILLNQTVVVDAFGTSYVAEISAGINGGWHLLNLSFVSSDVERLPSGNYLLTAFMVVDSAVETAIKVSTGTSGTDLSSAPDFVSTRLLLNETKSKILAQAVLVSADSQGNGA